MNKIVQAEDISGRGAQLRRMHFYGRRRRLSPDSRCQRDSDRVVVPTLK
jgi:hypothetical protein